MRKTILEGQLLTPALHSKGARPARAGDQPPQNNIRVSRRPRASPDQWLLLGFSGILLLLPSRVRRVQLCETP